MNWEDFAPLSTQPIGVQSDGTAVMLYPPGTATDNPPYLNPPPLDNSAQLVTISGEAGEEPTASLGAAVAVEENDVLPEGQWLFIETGVPMIVTSDGTALAPATGDTWQVSVA